MTLIYIDIIQPWFPRHGQNSSRLTLIYMFVHKITGTVRFINIVLIWIFRVCIWVILLIFIKCASVPKFILHAIYLILLRRPFEALFLRNHFIEEVIIHLIVVICFRHTLVLFQARLNDAIPLLPRVVFAWLSNAIVVFHFARKLSGSKTPFHHQRFAFLIGISLLSRLI